MLFAIICRDRPGHAEVRQANRAAHLDFLASLGDRLKGAGPFLDDDGAMDGSMILLEAEDRAAAEAVARTDPYAVAGLFSDVQIRPWKWAIKNPYAGS
ncbi:MAG TPA: YciI family protein [Kofleriaceae bacterium]|nr:YciI family protein [Kofleriaceae bacterium]